VRGDGKQDFKEKGKTNRGRKKQNKESNKRVSKV
jgi:hypothetical protein